MLGLVGLLVLLVLSNVVFVVTGGQQWVEQVLHINNTTLQSDPTVVSVFAYTLEDEVQKKSGIPKNGYVPQLLLQNFPGLVASDFDGVQASAGQYALVNGALKFNVSQTQLISDAAGAITPAGMQTLLNNIAKRTGINLQGDGTLTDVMKAIMVQR